MTDSTGLLGCSYSPGLWGGAVLLASFPDVSGFWESRAGLGSQESGEAASPSSQLTGDLLLTYWLFVTTQGPPWVKVAFNVSIIFYKKNGFVSLTHYNLFEP